MVFIHVIPRLNCHIKEALYKSNKKHSVCNEANYPLPIKMGNNNYIEICNFQWTYVSNSINCLSINN